MHRMVQLGKALLPRMIASPTITFCVTSSAK
jgi:hypothetical protein